MKRNDLANAVLRVVLDDWLTDSFYLGGRKYSVNICLRFQNRDVDHGVTGSEMIEVLQSNVSRIVLCDQASGSPCFRCHYRHPRVLFSMQLTQFTSVQAQAHTICAVIRTQRTNLCNC